MECLAWILIGVVSTALARASWLLSFKADDTNIGTFAAFVLGVIAWPFTLLFAFINALAWLVEPYEHKAVQWSDEWGKARYRQHCFWRSIWYLGNPPKEEDILSSWRFAPNRWKSK